MARKFLYFVAFCIVLVIAGRIVYELFQEELAEIALVPSAEFSPVKPLEANAYEDSKLWYSRPGIGVKDPARWQPPLTEGAPAATPDATKAPRFAVFFVHPTSYLNRASWNAPLENGGDPEAERLAAAYLIGWPVSLQHDLPAMGFPACAAPDQSACILSWSSFAEPADPALVLSAYGSTPALDGVAPGTTPMLCTNPLTGQYGGTAPASANLGTLVPEDSMEKGTLQPGLVPAACDKRGLLLIGPPPEMGSYVLPGNNYHVYDLPLFWSNTKADVIRRVEAWASQR